MTSNLVGRRDDGVTIKEFEASHGTVADLWHDHLDGKETSFNPLGMVEALIGAMQVTAVLLCALCVCLLTLCCAARIDAATCWTRPRPRVELHHRLEEAHAQHNGSWKGDTRPLWS